jgi:CDP-glucose 4,6-dehydratase
VPIRRPQAVRPWQHVLDPLYGYLLLAERLCEDLPGFEEGWNFGPRLEDAQPVAWVVARLAQLWGPEARWETDAGLHPHEAGLLCLDAAKATQRLGWQPRLGIDHALAWTVEWARALDGGADARALTLAQIDRYTQMLSPESR